MSCAADPVRSMSWPAMGREVLRHRQQHLFLRLRARTFQNVVSAPQWAPRPTAPALLNTRRPSPASMLLNSVPYGAALRSPASAQCTSNPNTPPHIIQLGPCLARKTPVSVSNPNLNPKSSPDSNPSVILTPEAN